MTRTVYGVEHGLLLDVEHARTRLNMGHDVDNVMDSLRDQMLETLWNNVDLEYVYDNNDDQPYEVDAELNEV